MIIHFKQKSDFERLYPSRKRFQTLKGSKHALFEVFFFFLHAVTVSHSVTVVFSPCHCMLCNNQDMAHHACKKISFSRAVLVAKENNLIMLF